MNSVNQDSSDKLLYKLVLQFAIYCQGMSKQLDPHLASITESLKKGINCLDLKQDLNALSKTLLHLSTSESHEENEPNPASDLSQQYFINRLNKLLSDTEAPLKFQNQCAILQQRSKVTLDDQSYKKVVDSAMSLLINIKNNAIHEKQGIESFLVVITSQLNALDNHATHVSKSNEQSIENRNNLNSAIGQQVENMQHSTTNATELASLQININQYLQELSSHLNKHKEDEDSRQFETKKQLKQLSQQLQEMEIEADSLRNNLKLAHDKALRDPLTGLPNRLAYEERLILEFNRWQRYEEPLSLIIWDIDLFKLINDNFGHKAGDKTPRSGSKCITY
jgi:diguanylate cyclase